MIMVRFWRGVSHFRKEQGNRSGLKDPGLLGRVQVLPHDLLARKIGLSWSTRPAKKPKGGCLRSKGFRDLASRPAGKSQTEGTSPCHQQVCALKLISKENLSGHVSISRTPCQVWKQPKIKQSTGTGPTSSGTVEGDGHGSWDRNPYIPMVVQVVYIPYCG